MRANSKSKTGDLGNSATGAGKSSNKTTPGTNSKPANSGQTMKMSKNKPKASK